MICFGEILWDCLPTGPVLGGAQLNMSVQMHNLGLKPTLISAVGKDALGDEMIADIKALGLDTSSVGQIDKYETSRVDILLDEEGKPTYDIKMPVAWDAIPINENHMDIAANVGVIFGTMAQRMEDDSRSNLDRLLEKSRLNFFDANFRLPFTTKELLLKYLPDTDIFKTNDDELPILMKWLNVMHNEEDGMKYLADKYEIKKVILTKGADGSKVLSNEKIYQHPGFKVTVADTVGCGDSFTAGIVYAMNHSWPVDQTIEFASAVSAVVASKKGGCCHITMEEVESILT